MRNLFSAVVVSVLATVSLFFIPEGYRWIGVVCWIVTLLADFYDWGWQQTISRTSLSVYVVSLLTTAMVVSFTWTEGYRWIGVVCWIVSLLLFLYNSIVIIPSQPPHKGLLTLFKRRQDVILNEGFNFLPLFPYVYGAILVQVVKINHDMNPMKIVIEDGSEATIFPSITISPKELRKFLDSGGEKTVLEILDDLVANTIRETVFSPGKGPKTWKEVMGGNEGILSLIMKRVIGQDLPPIVPEVGVFTTTLLRYFNQPQEPPLENERTLWGDDWATLTARISSLPADEQARLKDSVEERRKVIKAVMRGNGTFVHEMTGVVLHKLTYRLELSKAIADASNRGAEESLQREAEIIEMNHVRRLVADLLTIPGMTVDKAVQLVKVERGKTTEAINTMNFPPEIMAAIASALAGRP